MYHHRKYCFVTRSILVSFSIYWSRSIGEESHVTKSGYSSASSPKSRIIRRAHHFPSSLGIQAMHIVFVELCYLRTIPSGEDYMTRRSQFSCRGDVFDLIKSINDCCAFSTPSILSVERRAIPLYISYLPYQSDLPLKQKNGLNETSDPIFQCPEQFVHHPDSVLVQRARLLWGRYPWGDILNGQVTLAFGAELIIDTSSIVVPLAVR